MDSGFNGNIERERYYREILRALVEYEQKINTNPINRGSQITFR
jgi:hypothetical protein